MATAGSDILDTESLQALLGPQSTAEQARMIYDQGPEAVVFALLTLAQRAAERPTHPAARDPSAPSGQIPPYVKPTRQGRAKPKGGRPVKCAPGIGPPEGRPYGMASRTAFREESA